MQCPEGLRWQVSIFILDFPFWVRIWLLAPNTHTFSAIYVVFSFMLE